ncbi:MAG: EpsD family peptidyl-prolyl cis-trans isomerase [Burkholderiaceae bacterium]
MAFLDSSRRQSAGRLAVLALSAALAGCGNKSATGPEAPQILAKVNKTEISAQQFRYALQRQPQFATTARTESDARQVLDFLIDEELAVQAAQDAGLGNDAAVVQAMEATRREVLARAYQDRVSARAVSASADEVDRYYDNRPALFSERRLYTLQEFAMEASVDDQRRIPAALKGTKTAEEIAVALEKAGMRYFTRQFAQSAEDLSMGVLESVAKLTVGQSVLVQQGSSLRVYLLLHSEAAPVSRQQAKVAIEAFLLGERKRALLKQDLKALRTRATIVYGSGVAQSGREASSASAAK